ncbi:hypothetical protein VCHA53O466_50320 [Vibrio chagasii]|nr:hypothetical protein VCHA53O466_50320 [Vibrio chagasii]
MTDTMNQYNDVRTSLTKTSFELSYLKPRVTKSYIYCTTMTAGLLILGTCIYTVVILLTLSLIKSTPDGRFIAISLAVIFLGVISYNIVKFLRPEWQEAKALSLEKQALTDAKSYMTDTLDDIHNNTNTAKPDCYLTPSWIVMSYMDTQKTAEATEQLKEDNS